VEQSDRTLTPTHEVPGFEPWLGAMLGAFIPVVLAFVLPRTLMPYLFGAAGLLAVVGIVMFVQHERKAKRHRQG
jgi:hypothetical protein